MWDAEVYAMIADDEAADWAYERAHRASEADEMDAEGRREAAAPVPSIGLGYYRDPFEC